MYRRDLLTAEIQKLAQALARIMGLKQEGKLEEAENSLNETLAHDFGILYTDLLAADQENFAAFLTEKNFPAEKLDMFSQLLYLKFNPAGRTPDQFALAQKIQVIYHTLEVKHHVVNMLNLDRQKITEQFLKLNS
jgi:hypothetical protein